MISKAYPLFTALLLCSSAVILIGNQDPEITVSGFSDTRSNSPYYLIEGDGALISFARGTGSTGDGSADDPLTIRNVSIESVYTYCGMLIMDTTLHLEIRNCSFSNISLREKYSEDGGTGILLYGCRNIALVNCNISDNLINGLSVSDCTNISVVNCSIDGNGLDGITVYSSEMNYIGNNTFMDNGIYGIKFEYEPNSFIEIANNTFINCGLSLIQYSSINKCDGAISITNLVNDKPIRVERDITNGTISGDAGQLIMVNCSGVIVDDLTLTNCSVGITLVDCVNISFYNCSISGCEYGISGMLSDSLISGIKVFQNANGIDINGDKNIVEYCNISDNELGFTNWGIYCQIQGNIFSGNNIGVKSTIDTGHWSIIDNHFTDHHEDAIFLMDYMGGADIGCANISDNMFIDNDESGINLLQTAQIHVLNNTFIGGGTGIAIYSWDSRFENNTFSGMEQSILLTPYSDGHYFKNNNMSVTGIEHLVYSTYYYPDDNFIDQSNTLDGRPICYSIEESNLTIDYDYGQIILLSCTNVSIQDLTISNQSGFLQISMCTDVKITNNSFIHSGIDLVSSSDISFKYNQIQGTSIYMEDMKVSFQYNNIDGYCFTPWDYYYPSEITLDKNYWGDYLERYPGQVSIDGVYWFHPYEISSWNAVDYHPLVYPFDYTGPRSPVFVDDLTSDQAEAGEDLNLPVVIEDFHGIKEACVELRFSQTDHNITLNLSRNDTWHAHFPVPLINDSIWYRYQAGNIPGSWNRTDWKPVKIVDTYPPIIEDLSYHHATTGDPYMIRIRAEDNLPIDYISIKYWYGQDQNESIRFFYNNPTEWAVPISSSSLEPLRYRASVREFLGNVSTTEIREIPVLDNDPPIVGGLVDFSVNENEEFILNGSRCWDNIGIVNYTWTVTGSYLSVTKYGMDPRITLDYDGVYLVNLTISDAAGNLDENAFKIYVKAGPEDDTVDPEEPVPEFIQVPVGPVVDSNGNFISGAEIIISYGGTIIIVTTNEAGEAAFLLPRSWLGANLMIEIRKDGYYPSTFEILFEDSMSLYDNFEPLVPIPEEEPEEGDEDDDLDIRYLIIPLLIILALVVLAVYIIKVKGFPGYSKEEE